METFVVRVWMPDRPGALGQVASRIGAVHGDVVGIEILERGGGSVIDELRVTLPDASLVELLVAEIRQVDGVAVEDVRPIAGDRLDGALATLATAAAILEASGEGRLAIACVELRALLDADWVVALCVDRSVLLAASGAPPPAEWIGAFVGGSQHLSLERHFTPGDLLSAHLHRRSIALACGRAGRVFHARESEEFRMLAQIIDAIDRLPLEAGS
jgi:hypothetical protein